MEKRKHERYSLHVPIKIKHKSDTTYLPIEASSKDISSSGVFINTEGLNFQCNEKLQLELTLRIDKASELLGDSGRVILEIEGSVIRSQQNGVVIEFDKKYTIYPVKKG